MKCRVGNEWQCDEVWITELVSGRSMLRLWKLTESVKMRYACVCRLGQELIPTAEGGEGVVRDHGVRR